METSLARIARSARATLACMVALGALAEATAPEGSPIRFLIQPQVARVAPGMAPRQVDSILGETSSVGRYEWSKGGSAFSVVKYNLVVDHFVPAGGLGGETSTRVMPYFVIYVLPARKVAHAGTYRGILDAAAPEQAPILQAVFQKVVATDTSLCMRMGTEELLRFVQRNVGWKHPYWADRLTAFNVEKALTLLTDSLAGQPTSADQLRKMGIVLRARAVLGREPGFQKASQAFSRSLALDSNQFQSAFLLAQIRLVAGNPDSARLALQLFEHVRKRAKGELRDRAGWGIAVSQWRLGWTCRARLSLGEYLSMFPQDQGARILDERLRRPGAPSVPGDTACPRP